MGRKVDIESRVDEVLFYKEDHVAYNIVYYGRTELFTALDTDTVWQIKRITTSGTVKTVMYAEYGKYNCRWSDRYTYFPADPPTETAPTVSVSGSLTPSGLTIGGKLTTVTLNNTTWTALPPTALTNRNALSIQNISGSQIVIDYVTSNALVEGVVINSGAERFYSIKDTILIYGKSVAATANILIEELA